MSSPGRTVARRHVQKLPRLARNCVTKNIFGIAATMPSTLNVKKHFWYRRGRTINIERQKHFWYRRGRTINIECPKNDWYRRGRTIEKTNVWYRRGSTINITGKNERQNKGQTIRPDAKSGTKTANANERPRGRQWQNGRTKGRFGGEENAMSQHMCSHLGTSL